MIRIVEAAEADIPRILEIEQEAISPPWTYGSFLTEIFRADALFVVAVSEKPESTGKGILGFMLLRLTPGEGELLQIAVDKDARRCGLADMLMGAILAYAKKNALKSVFLEVRKSNEAAIELYKKHGYKPVSLRKNYYTSPIEDALIMAAEM